MNISLSNEFNNKSLKTGYCFVIIIMDSLLSVLWKPRDSKSLLLKVWASDLRAPKTCKESSISAPRPSPDLLDQKLHCN